MAKTAGNTHAPNKKSRRMRKLLACAIVVIVTACGGNTSPTNNLFDQQALLASLGANVILPALHDTNAAAISLQTATTAYQTAVEADADDVATKLEGARNSWRTFANHWQTIELYQVGPAGSSVDEIVGAQNFRDEVYSWPSVSTCSVDQEIISKDYEKPTFFSDELVLVYGLDALEYLLFKEFNNENTKSSCPPQVGIDTEWNTLRDDALLVQRQAAYATIIAQHIADTAKKLVDAWEPTKENYLATFSTAGDPGSIYKSSQSAINDVLAALFYLEIEVKDEKLAKPLGVAAEEFGVPSPDALESQWAHYSKQNIIANLRAFDVAFRGGENDTFGFDDVLVSLQAQSLVTTIETDTLAAIAQLESLPGSLQDAITNDLSSAQAVYTAVKKITDSLKGEFLTTLKLQIPREGAGDAD